MTDLLRVKVDVSGWEGGPGVNVLHFSQGTLIGGWDEDKAGAVLDDVFSAYETRKDSFAPGVVITPLLDVQIIESSTCNVINAFAATGDQETITATGSGGALSRGSSICLAYLTGTWLNGSRLIGRSYIGPIAAGCFTTDGQISAGVASLFDEAWAPLISGTGARLAVVRRPSNRNGTDGAYADVTQVVARRKPSHLRSRRD